MHDSNDIAMTDLVRAARDGDGRAREQLVAEHMPLVYNVVGRALDGHADVDDVVQETMFRALDGLAGLREPSSFRSWLIAIAMNQIRRRWTARQQGPIPELDRLSALPDPGGDFTGLTILRLGLSGQRREVAEATRWLDDNDRELLSLWWQEAAGHLDRAELAESLGVTPQHAAVRVQRMKGQLEIGRVTVRVLAARPRCHELEDLLAPWDGRPAPLWRKRINRHVRACTRCSRQGLDLVPAEGLLAGMALVVPINGFPALPGLGSALLPNATAPAGPGTLPAGPDAASHGASAGSGAPPAGPDAGSAAQGAAGPGTPPPGAEQAAAGGHTTAAVGTKVAATAGGVVSLSVLAVLVWPAPQPPAVQPPPAAPTVAAAPTVVSLPEETPSPTPTPEATPSPAPATSSAAPSTSAPGPDRVLIDLINERRAKAGCPALKIDNRLTTAARKHAQDMAARNYFDHASPEGKHADDRITAAGYEWGMWGENLDRGPTDPKTVVNDWTDGAIHQQIMLDCRYKDAGAASVPSPRGTLWVLDLARTR
ncbi:sigma-70 family RNA polymerase sigma factor [Kitasatospora camelliae]|uniref:Sigma-70 family RNA polymerase sigma factor n=1 Tax=Kitasatospora camelliae TaxID=3156397 RepID=A0AAU8K4V7_9ACTN